VYKRQGNIHYDFADELKALGLDPTKVT